MKKIYQTVPFPIAGHNFSQNLLAYHENGSTEKLLSNLRCRAIQALQNDASIMDIGVEETIIFCATFSARRFLCRTKNEYRFTAIMELMDVSGL